MNSDLIELLQLLNDRKVRYLVIGGQAVILHFVPRYTKDVNLWIEPTERNAARFFEALQEFGAPTSSITQDDLATPGTVFIFGLEPNRVDILTRVKGADFGASFKRRCSILFKGVKVNFISLEDLIRIKRATARPQDLLDLQNLLIAKRSARGARTTKVSTKKVSTKKSVRRPKKKA